MVFLFGVQLDLLTNFFFSEVRVEGLETMDYLDNLKAKERFTEQGDAIVFETEVGDYFMLRTYNFT